MLFGPRGTRFTKILNSSRPEELSTLKSVANALLTIILNSAWQPDISGEQLTALVPYLDLNHSQAFHESFNTDMLPGRLTPREALPPLHYISSIDPQGSDKIEALLRCGASLEHHDYSAPLHLAVVNNHISNVETFLQQGEDVNKRDTLLGTCLMRAADKDLPDMIEFLLRHGANLSGKDTYERTALHSATINGSMKALETFIKMEPDIFREIVNVRDKSDRTALDDAHRRGKRDFLQGFKNLLSANGLL
ncbi:hypothetical protein FSARC_14778 [Fusarium sarcochroum]|uniref:Ankyrin repeat protein n=1 Tax=Fusarium sarcochroum TaxID=1208366 RepID=A0A8H4SQW7_9HYPO|nr:hypothetical protein FSARC_14778 [Fusarium sarcochroum]